MKTTDNFADLTINLKTNTENTSHEDITHLQRVNIFRDFLYEQEPELLFERNKGEIFSADTDLLKNYFKYSNAKIFKVSKRDIKPLKLNGDLINPRKGRFYPKGILSGISSVFSANMHPFRCLQVEKDLIYSDFNFPPSDKSPKIEIRVDNIIEKTRNSGASCRHILEDIMTGPGMGSRFNNRPTDFFSDDPFSRISEVDDVIFYKSPRITAHTDALCRKNLEKIYQNLIKPDSRVLDLMTSTFSHYPKDHYLDVYGIGMNMEEMSHNKQLSKRIVQDLNNDPILPFGDDKFDYITCSMSVEYLTRPFEVFKEAARVLKKDGLFIVSFSNRWFPGKEIKIWRELHDYEKMGLVSEYFFDSGLFYNIKTKSLRGFPRPYDKTDRYRDTLWFSDPLFVVYAGKK
jgi:SAM-dependent methyltransferase